MEAGKINGRDIGLDVTRIVAYLSVLSVHFFLNSGFYEIPVEGERMYVMTAMRTMFMVCVPLFLLLTGYLSSSQEIKITKENLLHRYAKLEPLLLTYFLADMLVLLLARKLYFGENVTVGSALLNVLSYQQYAWYINMYIGLALLIPFLNLLWKNLQTRQEQGIWIIVLAALTMLPSILNFKVQLVPNWWGDLYPVTYYYIGAYLKKNVDIKKLSTAKIAAALLAAWSCFSVFNIWINKGGSFQWGVWCSWGGVQNVVDSVLVFLLLNSIHYPEVPPRAEKCIAYISKITLPAYLLSWIPDKVNYPKLNSLIEPMQVRMNYYPIMVGVSVLVSLLLAAAVQESAQLLLRGKKTLLKKVLKEKV